MSLFDIGTQIRFKKGVKIADLTPQTVLAIFQCRIIYEEHGLAEMWITSIDDGRHGRKSKHYAGNAFDLRTKQTGVALKLYKAVKESLDPLGFDTVLEDFGNVNEHIHVEWDPKPYEIDPTQLEFPTETITVAEQEGDDATSTV